MQTGPAETQALPVLPSAPRIRPPTAVPCDRLLHGVETRVAASGTETPSWAHRRPSGWGASLVDPMPGRMSGAGKHSSELETNPTAPPYQDLAGPLLQRTHSQFAAQLERALHSRWEYVLFLPS